ncbi:tyrosine--tRNA ligase [Patescibacteria group bacterium]|nr:tyrosine--tRNA ligase [Patescibacteria group bacterium]MCL5114610.1 tyrosine--tRNA ligase [Patescibacteria group bacterium]
MRNKEELIRRILNRGVEEIIEKESLTKKLDSGKKLRVKFGIDPTKPDIHLGHTVPLLKLREFQELGHKAVLIIGDFTAQIGDPSGQSAERKPLTEKEVKMNMKHYLEQAGKVIDIKKAEVRYNSEWHKKEGLMSMLTMARAASIQQVMKRREFKERINAGGDITLLEFLYPLFQGYDSVKIKSDVEIGGTDQKFNLLMGRRVQRHFGVPEQDIITVPLIEGTDGIRKMSKSFGNYIGIAEAPNDIFSKVMSVPDALLAKYFENLTETKPTSNDPYQSKMLLGETIVRMYHGQKAAEKAKENFVKTFSKKEMPDEIEIKTVSSDALSSGTTAMLVAIGAAKSNSEARRLIDQGAVKVDGRTVSDPNEKRKDGEVLKVGKHRFFKLRKK